MLVINRGHIKPWCLLLVILAFSCNKDASLVTPTSEPAARSVAGNGMTIMEIPFTATAQIAYCWGENIRITGIIENHVKVTETDNNNHYTRTWTVKNLTGVGVTTGGMLTGTQYVVTGGAEMFSIKDAVLNPNGSLNLAASLTESDVVIHRGQIMLENIATGDRVLARHDIQKVPGQGIAQNRWRCFGK